MTQRRKLDCSLLVCDVDAAEKRRGTMRVIQLGQVDSHAPDILWMRFACDICGAETAKVYVKMFTTDVPMLTCPNCFPESME